MVQRRCNSPLKTVAALHFPLPCHGRACVIHGWCSLLLRLPRVVQDHRLCPRIHVQITHDDTWCITGDGEDTDEAASFDVAYEAFDRLALAVGGAVLEPLATPLLLAYLHKEAWEAKFAALMALSQLPEGCHAVMKRQLPHLTELALRCIHHNHPRVRLSSRVSFEWYHWSDQGKGCIWVSHIEAIFANGARIFRFSLAPSLPLPMKRVSGAVARLLALWTELDGCKPGGRRAFRDEQRRNGSGVGGRSCILSDGEVSGCRKRTPLVKPTTPLRKCFLV